MKAIRIHNYGDVDVLRYEDAPEPRIAADEVLVEVHAAGVNPVDWKIRKGALQGMISPTFPLILGWDVSGVVTAIGADVQDVAVGDEIFSRPDIGRDGSYAERIAIRASEVALRPRSVSHAMAAAVPLAGLTAWQSLFEAASLKEGQRVLIHAAAGGVGSLAVQIAKSRGATVFGTASAANADFLRELGVDEVIDYRSERFEERAQGIDVVFDTMGGEVQARSWQTLKAGGVLVSIVSTPDAELAKKHGVEGHFVFVQPDRVGLGELAKMVDAGTLRLTIHERFGLADAAAAHRVSESGRTRGKLIIDVR